MTGCVHQTAERVIEMQEANSPMPTPSSTQIGAIAVNHVANVLMITSGGRLSTFWPVADDDGIDLLIYDKLTGRAMPAQVKSRTVALKKKGSSERGNVVHFEIRKATFRADRYACAIFVLLSADAASIERAWVMPMLELPKYAASRESKYVVRANKALDTRDRCSELQCKDWTTLGERVLRMIQQEPKPSRIGHRKRLKRSAHE